MKTSPKVDQAIKLGAYFYIRVHGNDLFEVIAEKRRAGEWITVHEKCSGDKLEKTLNKCAKQFTKARIKQKEEQAAKKGKKK